MAGSGAHPSPSSPGRQALHVNAAQGTAQGAKTLFSCSKLAGLVLLGSAGSSTGHTHCPARADDLRILTCLCDDKACVRAGEQARAQEAESAQAAVSTALQQSQAHAQSLVQVRAYNQATCMLTCSRA